jgi:hypothetical protein
MSTLGGTAVGDLDEHQCWEFLRAATVGRLAITISGRPEIFPINFVVDHGTIVFRSAAGTKVSGLHADTSAAFEVDGLGPDDSTAWSVVIHGQLESVPSSDPVTTDVLPLYPLHGGAKSQFVRVVPDAITGRWFPTVDPSTWRTTLAVGRSQAWE